jgi:hypothetical protein
VPTLLSLTYVVLLATSDVRSCDKPLRTPLVKMSSLPPMPQMPNPFAPFFVTDVFTYKTFQDTPIQTDVHVPKDIEPGDNLPMLLVMHGGSLVCGVIFSLSSCVISTFVQLPRPIAILLPKPRFANAHDIAYIAYSI